MAKQVFLSYSTDDAATAVQVRDSLEVQGIACWMAPRDIVPGKEYAEQILDAIEGCSVMVLVVSETANVSRFVRNEVERAVSKDKVIIPVRIHAVALSRSLEFFISSAQWIDAVGDINGAVLALASAIRAHLGVAVPQTEESGYNALKERPQLKLSTPATPFVGRSREIDDILSRLLDPACRLLSLVGQGGMGKTRLAIEVARRAYERDNGNTSDGVFFVPLETLNRPEQIPVAIASALGPDVEGADSFQLVQRFLAGKRLLLVLDNFEHVLDGADLVAELLSAAPHVKVLVTSRETLNLHEEWYYPVEGMALPIAPTDPPEQARLSDAVQMFLQAARRARPNLYLDGELAHIVTICRLVEGSPLAMDLAAHWLRTIPCAHIVDELRKGLDLLATPERNVPRRHRSMRAIFDYSWQMADNAERKVLCQLPVFVGGFDWSAYDAVTRGTLSILSRLVESSWVRVDEAGRYTLHPLVRSYLAEQLEYQYPEMAGEGPEHVRDRHSQHYADEAAKIDDAILRREIDNVVAGFRHATDRLNIESLHTYVYRYTAYWVEWPLPIGQKDALFAAAVDRVRTERFNCTGTAAASALQRLEAMLLAWQVNILRRAFMLIRAQALCEEALALQEGLGIEVDSTCLHVHLLWQQAGIYHMQGYYQEAYASCHKARELNEVFGDLFYDGLILHILGLLAADQGNYDQAAKYQRQGLAAMQCSGRAVNLHMFYSHLGRIAVRLGEYAAAKAQLEEATRLGGSLYSELESGVLYAELELLSGYPEMAIDRCKPQLQVAENHGLEIPYLLVLANASLAVNRLADAEHYFRRLYEQTEHSGRSRARAVALIGLGRLETIYRRYAQSSALYVQAIDGAWPSRMLPEVLSALIGLAEIEVQTGNVAKAVQWLAIVSRHPAAVHAERVRTQALLAELRTELSEEESAIAQSQGDALDLDTIVAGFLQVPFDAKPR